MGDSFLWLRLKPAPGMPTRARDQSATKGAAAPSPRPLAGGLRLLFSQLAAFFQDDLRFASIALDQAGDTNPLAFQLSLRRPKFRSVFDPDYSGENVSRVRLV